MGEEFETISKHALRQMTKKERTDYYKKLRAYLLTEEFDTADMQKKKNLHNLLASLIKLNRVVQGQKIHIVSGEIKETNRPIIFAPTHQCKFDIPILSEVVKKYHYYLLSGDHYNLPETFDGLLIGLNGVVYVDRDDKNDRKVSKETAIRILQNGGNMMIYPEGTWNLTDNLLVLPLNIGIIEIAKRSNAIIVPMSLDTPDGKNFYVSIGDHFDALDYYDNVLAINTLRDTLATLRLGNLEEVQKTRGGIHLIPRETVSKEEFEIYLEKRISECNYLTREELLKYVRREKDITEPEEVTGYFYRMDRGTKVKTIGQEQSNFFTRQVNTK